MKMNKILEEIKVVIEQRNKLFTENRKLKIEINDLKKKIAKLEWRLKNDG